jgi:indolepyruvate ferredoxin oxidoreductase beta subunit
VNPVTILIAALGGQGGGVLAEWLVEAASRAGFPAQSTSIPGVAQRTGATTYYVEVFPVPRASLGGREPILSLLPAPGAIDLLIASELLEGARMVQAGFADPARTTFVASTSRTLTTAEKMSLGDGRFASDRLVEVAKSHSRRYAGFDMDAAARDAGTMVSAVMLGAIAASGVLPFGVEACRAAIGSSGPGADASLRGFDRGCALTRDSLGPGAPSTAPRDAHTDPAGEIVALGVARVTDFQDAAYAKLYLERVERVRAAEAAADPRGGHGRAATREAARFLALWMAYDDIARVADLKGRASRHARVRREAGARDGDVVRVADYFKPGVPEVAGVLPPSLAQRLVAWDRRRQARGRAPFALPMTVRTDAIGGTIAMRALAGLRGVRRRGSRYAEEQAGIERWLDAIVRGLGQDWRLGYEIALCGRLIKGYGATNLRGKRNLAHILDHLATADAICDARDAALADEGGRDLDHALARHGAPARPVVAQPIRFVKRMT